MADYIRSPMTGEKIDELLKAFNGAESEESEGLIMYIKDGKLAFDTEENLFNIVEAQ